MNSREKKGKGEPPLEHLQAAVAFLKRHSCITLRDEQKSPYPFSASELLDTELGSTILQLQASLLGKPESAVVGTLFAKRFSVFCIGLFAACSLFDLRLSSSPEAVRFRLAAAAKMEYETAMLHPSMLPTEHMSERECSVAADSAVFRRHLESIFQSVSAHTGANINVMWSLVSHNLQTMYARIECDPSLWRTEERLRLIRLDRDTIFARADGNRLALKLRSLGQPAPGQAPLLQRKHCCLAYKLKAEGYCRTCPKL